MKKTTLLQRLEQLGLRQDETTALLMLPLMQVAWADGRIDQQEQDAILSFAIDNDLVTPRGRDRVIRWLTDPPSRAYIQSGMDLLIELAWETKPWARGVSVDRVATAIDFCQVIARTTDDVLTGEMPRADRQALGDVQAEVARLHAEHGPDRGVVGRPLTQDWIDLLDELKRMPTYNRVPA